MSLSITDVRVTPFESQSQVCGFATITFNDSLVTDGWRIINGRNGLFVSGPSKKDKDDNWKDTIFFLNKEDKEGMQERVITAYNEARGVKSGGSKSSSNRAQSQVPEEYASYTKTSTKKASSKSAP